MQPEILRKTGNKTADIYVKSCHLKHTCNDDNSCDHHHLAGLVFSEKHQTSRYYS